MPSSICDFLFEIYTRVKNQKFDPHNLIDYDVLTKVQEFTLSHGLNRAKLLEQTYFYIEVQGSINPKRKSDSQ